MLFGVGCQKESSDANSDVANITVAPETISTTIAGGEYELTVTSNASWSASCDQAGVEFTPKEGVGNGTVKVVIPEKATLPFDITFNATKKATMNGIEYDSPASATVHVQNANAKTYFEETFEESQGEFTINDVVLGEGLTYVWNHENGQYGYYMKASAYKGGPVPSESWLISPEITLAGATAPAVSFEHCHKFAGTPSDELTLWISEDKGVNWAQLTIPVYGTNNDYSFVANTIDLTSYVGKNVQIAFKYVATSTHAGTWEVRNFKVAEGNGSTTEPEQPGDGGGETPDVPASGVYTSDAAFICKADNSTNKCYTLGESKINGAACSGVKLGTSKNAGFFTSTAVGVEGTKTLSFYGMAWKGASATIYVKVEGSSEGKSVAVKANDGATGNPPYTITVTDADYYSVELTGLTADSKIVFSTDATFSTASSTAARAVLAGITLK